MINATKNSYLIKAKENKSSLLAFVGKEITENDTENDTEDDCCGKGCGCHGPEKES